MNPYLDRRRLMGRRARIALALVLLAIALPTGSTAALAGNREGVRWLGAWSASPQSAIADDPIFPLPPALASVHDQTVRDIVHTHFGGSLLRARVSNAFGNGPLHVAQADVAVSKSGAATVPGSDRRLSFGGSRKVTVAAGAEAYSDPVSVRVDAGENLAVSLYVSGDAPALTWHADGVQTNYISGAGNHAEEVSGASFATAFSSFVWLDGVDVLAPGGAGAVVALGDSLTDGRRSTLDANHRWPDFLAQRLTQRGEDGVSVLNEGISGNRLLASSPCLGQSGLARFDRDVVGQHGVRSVIELLGLNDIYFAGAPPNACFPANPPVSSADVIAGLQQLIARAHVNGLKIYGGTITPTAVLSSDQNRERQRVNEWIKTSRAFDAVIDFDSVLRDPTDTQLLPAYDSGDSVHPNDAGYKAMADAVPLALLETTGRSAR